MSDKLYLLKQEGGWLDACGEIWYLAEGDCNKCGKEKQVLKEGALQICFDCLEPANIMLVEETDKEGYINWLANCIEYGADIVKSLVTISDACKDVCENLEKLTGVLQSMTIYTNEMRKTYMEKGGYKTPN